MNDVMSYVSRVLSQNMWSLVICYALSTLPVRHMVTGSQTLKLWNV